ncbi:T9SS type A sorting domain-containing protein [Neolewinella persica]|uniref:T9SS type A sorting domain-containing protein n=1 Tax=Neolewinella persica TaxID=70998 RepID=UPI00036752D1|nr:T9SS type A sorting domain-containing protein [Neolewinella persica]
MNRFLLLFAFLLSTLALRAQTNITFCVDMTSVAGSTDFAAQAIAFDFNGFNSGGTPLSDPEGDNIFCGTFSLGAGEVRFNFFYAAAGGAGGPENLDPLAGQACVNSGDGGIKRTYTVLNGQPETISFVWESCDGSMPVELTGFSGEAMAKHNRLYWTTAREENVQWHILERSNRGRNNWEEVARTQGAMFSTEEQGYTLDDETPPSTAYYRLRSVDYDGSEGISPIVLLERSTDGIVIQAFPNPAGDRLDVVLNSKEVRTAGLSLFTADGREVLSDNRRLNAGSNNISLNLRTVPTGIYFLRVGEQVMRVVRN